MAVQGARAAVAAAETGWTSRWKAPAAVPTTKLEGQGQVWCWVGGVAVRTLSYPRPLSGIVESGPPPEPQPQGGLWQRDEGPVLPWVLGQPFPTRPPRQ